MKKVIGIIITCIIAPVIVGIIVFNFTQKKPNIKYTLSEAISITSTNESIQQLTVKNTGNDIGKNIIVKCKENILSYEIVPNSKEDKYTIHDEDNCLELAYPQLPPDASINVVLYSNKAIDINSVCVRYDSGLATEALKNDSNNSQLMAVELLMLLTFISYTFISIHNVIKQYYIEQANFGDIKKILKRKVPFLMKEEKWNEIVKEALDVYESKIYCMSKNQCLSILKDVQNDNLKPDMVDRIQKVALNKIIFEYGTSYYYNKSDIIEILNISDEKFSDKNFWNKKMNEIIDITHFVAEKKSSQYFTDDCILRDNLLYSLLDSKKPENMDSTLWNKLIKNIQDSYFTKLNQYINTAIYDREEKIKKIWEVRQPEQINDTDWKDYINRISQCYIIDKEWCLFCDNFTITQLSKLIQLSKPQLVTEKDWNRYKDFLNDFYLVRLYKSLFSEEYVEDNLISYIYQSSKHEFQKIYDNVRLVRFYENSIYLDYKTFSSKAKPDYINNHEYDNLREYIEKKCILEQRNHELIEKSENLHNQIEEFRKNEDELNKMIYKVNFQLDFINDLLNGNDCILRLEDYNNSFSEKNYENLKRISKLMNKLQQENI